MVKQYAAFLVRYWRLENSEQRIEIEEIRSGVKTQVASASDAVAWIRDHAALPGGEERPSDPAGSARPADSSSREEAEEAPAGRRGGGR